MFEEDTLPRATAVSRVHSAAVYQGGADNKTAHALILVPSAPEKSAAWYPLARFILSWQIRWLRHAGLSVTVVADDDVMTAQTLNGHIAGEDESDVLTWNHLDSLPHAPSIDGREDCAVVAMMGPLLIDCDLAQLLASHKSGGRAVTAIRQRARDRKPVAYIFSQEHIATNWPALKARLRAYASQPNQRFALSGHGSVARGNCELLTRADRRQLRRLEDLWKICAPHAGLAPVPNHPSVFSTPENAPALAPTVRLRGPVMIGANVTVGANTTIGPWALLESNSEVSRSVWIEMAAIGADAEIGQESCVYNSIVDPQTRVVARAPLLKVHHSPLHTSPQPLPCASTPRTLSRSYRVAKRVLDLVGASLALIIALPLLCAIAIVCLVAQGWPVLFVHTRCGLDGRLFPVLKFRTMRRNTDHGEYLRAVESSTRFKLDDDQRVTRLGWLLRRTSLDELPQLLNVLKGDMSLVGPRPVVSQERMRRGVYASDLGRVKPGMTGLWQINGRSATTYARRIMLDTQYADQCTLWLDLAIMLRTLPAVISRRGSV